MISGDHDVVKAPCLIIMNHRTRLDWLFLWCYLLQRGKLLNEKIILKDAIKRIPIIGRLSPIIELIAIEYAIYGYDVGIIVIIILV